MKVPHSCGTRDGLQVFEQDDGEITGYCFSCHSFVKDPLGGQSVEDFPVKKRIKKSPEEIQAEIDEISTYPVDHLRDRKLHREALDYYGIKLGYNEEDGTTIKFIYFPYYEGTTLKSYKVKLVENKKFWSVGDQSDVDLFGWQQAIATGARRLIITEGELDAPALLACLKKHTKTEYRDNIPAVVSLPHGSSSAGRDLARLAPKIRKHFKEVSFCFDNDAAGEKAVEEGLKVLPEATVITLPLKDAGDCLMQGRAKAAHAAAVFNAGKPKNTSLVNGRDLHEAAKTPAKWGVSWPWKKLTDLTRGVRTGETYYLGAAQKMGWLQPM